MMTSDHEHNNVNSFPTPKREDTAELAQHIMVQLKSSYNRLLDEPLPENIRKLLTKLDQRENDS